MEEVSTWLNNHNVNRYDRVWIQRNVENNRETIVLTAWLFLFIASLIA